MPKVRLAIEPLAIAVHGPLSIGTGFRWGLINRTVARDSDGLAYVPASSLKGCARDAAEKLARQAGLKVCRSPRPEDMCSAHQRACLVCRVFGAPGQGSTLRWHDARLSADCREAFSDPQGGRPQAGFYVRTQVQLSRVLGTAAPERLYTSEFVAEDLTFESAIDGWLDLTPIGGDKSTAYELLLLVASLKTVNALGGARSRGGGQCRILLPEGVRVDAKTVPLRDLLDNLDLLGEYQREVADAR